LANIFYHLNRVQNYQPVISVENFFTEEEMNILCLQLKTVNVQAGIVGSNVPTNTDEYEKKRLYAHKVRKCNVSFLQSDDWLWLYDKLSIAINHVNLINYNKLLYGLETLQYTEYDSKYNGFIVPHIDAFDDRVPLVRSLSFSMQLSREDEYEGGELKLYEEEKENVMDKSQGTLIMFPSYVLHEVMPITNGERYSLLWFLQHEHIKIKTNKLI
jgi:PKHD-type hydroxylase